MAVTIAITRTDNTNNQFIIDGTLTLTGNYGSGGGHGDVLNFATFDIIKTQQLPIEMEIFESIPAGTLGTGNAYYFTPGTTLANGKMQIWTPAGAEYTQGSAYGSPPFGVTGYVLKFRAWINSFV